MPWNPEVYNEFKDLRFQPFYDLAGLIKDKPGMKAIDLGCGTGEQTAILADKFQRVYFTGIDASPEMLAKSKTLEHDRLQFRLAETERIITAEEKWDLIFSNAALQWSDQHETLFPSIISKLNSGGQLAIQMPYQPENKLNQLLVKLAEEEPFKTQLNGWNRYSPVLTIDAYAQLLFENGLQDITIMQKVYPIIATDHNTLYNFIAGSALIPYMEKLGDKNGAAFISRFKERITAAFPTLPSIYAFKRILMYGEKK